MVSRPYPPSLQTLQFESAMARKRDAIGDWLGKRSEALASWLTQSQRQGQNQGQGGSLSRQRTVAACDIAPHRISGNDVQELASRDPDVAAAPYTTSGQQAMLADTVTGSPRTPLYRSTKTYDHSEGLSCCFRQWRAKTSHCSMVHGYALSFKFVFATHELDERNWCFDFGGLKPVRAWLHEMFDHTMLVAEDDPHLQDMRQLEAKGLVSLRILPRVGCEAMAEYVFRHVARFIAEQTADRVWLETVEVSEHGGNSALYQEG